jgi:iron complex transport system permease protein
VTASLVPVIVLAGADGDRSRIGVVVLAALACLLALAFVFSVAAGPTGFMPWRALSLVTGMSGSEISPRDAVVILDIRLPRAVMGAMIGAALASSGCVMQGLFRNPLADPGIVGASSGAALAAVTMIVLGGPFVAALPVEIRIYAMPVAAFAGALAVTALLYGVATRESATSVAMMLLAGIALGGLASAALGFLIFQSDESQLRELTFWTLGSIAGSTWDKLVVLLPFVAVALIAFQGIAGDLDAMLLGESEASHLGVSTEWTKRVAILGVAGAVGASVAMSGVIGFVGIVVPHLLRLATGPSHRFLLPASALLGAILLLAADLVSRTVVAPAELPIGILTALIGSPFFLWLLIRRRALVGL